jgi:DNA repair exonuclease SbcCD ATPase subunit
VAAPELIVLDEIQRLLARAEMQILHLALTTPEGDSAFDTYHQILFLQPNHEAALAGIQQIGIKYAHLANLAVVREDFQRARSYAAKASELAPEHHIFQALVIPPEAVPFNEEKTLTVVTVDDIKATQQTSIEMREVTEDSERSIAPAPSVAEQELERLQTLFGEIVEQTEARIQQQSEAVAASNAETARRSEELAKAQQEIERLTAALNEAETAGTEVDKARAEAEARIEQQAEAIIASNAETARRSEELAKAQQEIERLTTALIARVRAHAEARIASNAEAARRSKELVVTRQQMNELKSGLANAQSTLKELDTEFDALSDAIVERIEQLFVAATFHSVDDIRQLRAKIGATTEQIDKLGESFRDAKGGELGSDDHTEFSTGVEPELIIEASQTEN